MDSPNNHQETPPTLELFLSTTTGIIYGLGIAILILSLFGIALDSDTLSAMTEILSGISI